MLTLRLALPLSLIGTLHLVALALPSSRDHSNLPIEEGSHPVQSIETPLNVDDDLDDFDTHHDQYQSTREVGQSSSSQPFVQEYKVELTPEKYLYKHNLAFMKHDLAKMNKNERKRLLLINNDIGGMKRLENKYQREWNKLRDENVIHRSEAGRAGGNSEEWARLTEALLQGHHEPLYWLKEDVMNEKERELISDEAQYQAARLSHSFGIPLAFSVIRSENQIKNLQAQYESEFGKNKLTRDKLTRDKLEKAIHRHEHVIQALIYKSAEDACALSDYYYDIMIHHAKILDEKKEKEDRVRLRQFAWRDKADEVEEQMRRHGNQR